MRGRAMTYSGTAPKVKDQPQGLIVLERAKSVEASERKRFSKGQSQDDNACMEMMSSEKSSKISKSRRSRSTVSLPAQPAQLHETSFTDMSPKTINLLDSSVVNTPSNRSAPYRMPASDSKESLLSANPRFHNPLSPFSKKKSMPEADPRATPIFLDGGNIFSTKMGGVYRIKQPVNDLEGNDRRREHRRVQLDSNSGNSFKPLSLVTELAFGDGLDNSAVGYAAVILKIGPSGAQYYFCFNLNFFFETKKFINKRIISGIPIHSCSIIISAQLHVITVQVYTAFNSSRTKENITTKRRRSFAFVFECRRSSQRTNN